MSSLDPRENELAEVRRKWKSGEGFYIRTEQKQVTLVLTEECKRTAAESV